MTHSSLLSDLMDLYPAFELDSSTDLDKKKQRDRRIGQALEQHRKHPTRQIRGWIRQVDIPGWKRDGHEGAQLYHVLCLVLVIVGLATGWGLARAVLYYTGDAPINVVNALGILVFPQIVLLLMWLLAAIPRRVPLFSSLQSALRFLNPGRLAGLVARLFPRHRRQNLEALWDSENAIVLAPAARWLFSLWSQLFSFWFNVGVLVAAFYLILFSDLAFAWSTTLNLDNAAFQRILSALSWPWHALIPDAVPSSDLIEISRFYRLEDAAPANGSVSAERAARLGGWWPFLLAAIVCYGLLPRLLTLIVSWLRFRRHLGEAMTRVPGSPELLARMNSPLITTAALQPELRPQLDAGSEAAPGASAGSGLKCTVVDWSGAVDKSELISERISAMGIEAGEFLSAGGARSTSQDRETVASLCRNPRTGVVVIAKAWEPPLLEFLDFIQLVRAKCDRRQAIIVLLWGGPSAVSESDRESWQTTLRQLKDPDLHVEAIGTAP